MTPKTLLNIPNVGPATVEDFNRLGIQTPRELEGRDARELYEALGELDGEPHDPCVEDVFRAAIHYVETGEEVHWSEFSRRRKAGEFG